MSKSEEQKTFMAAWYEIADLRTIMEMGKTAPHQKREMRLK